MSPDELQYCVTIRWTGNRGPGTTGYRDYDRDHTVSNHGAISEHGEENVPAGARTIPGSADPLFRGDPDRWNPEQLLVAAASQCHMLWYLHLAASSNVTVVGYVDRPVGVLALDPDGSGRFRHVTLHPVVTLADPGQQELAHQIHQQAAEKCFIARSVNFPIHNHPEFRGDG